ncbi:hypothetical protein [Paraburkholderia phytofirmans]
MSSPATARRCLQPAWRRRKNTAHWRAGLPHRRAGRP